MDPLLLPPTFQILPVMTIGFGLLITDLLFYGILVPMTGAAIAAALARAFDLSGYYEIYLVILTVIGMFYFTFSGFRFLRLEPKFWRNLFARDKGYLTILQIRDIANLYMLYCSVRLLYYAILEASELKGMGLKQENLGEGIGFVFWNGLMEAGFDIPQYFAKHYPWTPEVQKTSFWAWGVGGSSSMSGQNLKMAQMINGAKLVLAIAGITASIMKLSYFAVLHTYVRAMNIFTDMQDASPPQTPGGAESIHGVVSESIAFNFNARDRPAKDEVPEHAPRPSQSNPITHDL